MVGRDKELDAGAVHLAGTHRQDDWLASSLPDRRGDIPIFVKMNVMPFHFLQASAADRFDEVSRRAMKKQFGRFGGSMIELDFDRMPLIGSNSQAIAAEGEPLFVVLLNDKFELVTGQIAAMLGHRRQQYVDVDPPRFVQ